jgi:hypothetical protein
MGWREQAPVTAISARSSHLIERIAPLRWWEEAANVSGSVADQGDELGEDYRGWPLRDRLKLLAFDGRLAGVPQALMEAIWEAIDRLSGALWPQSPPSVRRPSWVLQDAYRKGDGTCLPWHRHRAG